MLAWLKKEEARKKKKKVDNMYEGQYQKLFPSDEHIPNMPAKIQASDWIINGTLDDYIYVWQTENTIPNISAIYERMVFRVHRKIDKIIEEKHSNEPCFWETGYRDELFAHYEDIYWETDGVFLEETIKEVLNSVMYTYYEPDEDKLENPAQRCL